MDAIKDIDLKDDVIEESEKVEDKYKISLKIKSFEDANKTKYTFNAICHTYFIVKEEG